MLSLRSLAFLRINSSHALFQSKEGLINFSALNSSFFIVFFTISSSLTSCKINEEKFTALLDTFFLDFDLTNSMTSAWSLIWTSCMGSSHKIALVDKLKNLFLRRHELLWKSLDLDLLIFVLHYLQLFVVIQQVIQFTSIYLVHGNCDCKVALIILPVVNSALKQVLHSQILKTLHGECLSRACLSISEDGDSSGIENEI